MASCDVKLLTETRAETRGAVLRTGKTGCDVLSIVACRTQRATTGGTVFAVAGAAGAGVINSQVIVEFTATADRGTTTVQTVFNSTCSLTGSIVELEVSLAKSTGAFCS